MITNLLSKRMLSILNDGGWPIEQHCTIEGYIVFGIDNAYLKLNLNETFEKKWVDGRQYMDDNSCSTVEENIGLKDLLIAPVLPVPPVC